MSRRQPRQITPKQLLTLWLKYTEFKRPSIAYSTRVRDYAKVEQLIRKLPQTFTTAVAIRDWVVKTYSAEYARKMIQQFNACCSWAFDSDLHPSSPFAGMNRHFRQTQKPDAYRAFTPTERDTIINRFTALHPYYLPWVKFLFWTGCRPEEARALRWEHINPDLSLILFKIAAPVDTKREQGTKNHRERDFPTNPKIRSLLQSLQKSPYDRTAYILPGKSGGAFEYHNFQSRYWNPTLEALVDERLVFTNLSQYHMRHTWITLALEQGLDIATVAYLSGNSPEVIWKHYAARKRLNELPDI